MRCCVNECRSDFVNGTRSHCIPSMQPLRDIWLEKLKIRNPGPNDRICSKHFKVTDYKELKDNGPHKLKSDSIPSENLPVGCTDRGYHEWNGNKDETIDNKDVNVTQKGNKVFVRNITPLEGKTKKIDSKGLIKPGFELKFDEDIREDERTFYLKLFPRVDLVKEKKSHCTSCNTHLGTAPANESNIFMHPILKVSQCKKCNEFYNSGEFSKGEDGSELYCRWCGQGGEVYCCAKCPFVFCKACISINLAKSLVADIRDNENWNCFVCSPKITWPIRATHWALKNYIEKQKKNIQKLATNEIEEKRLMKKDTSTCCARNKTENETDSSNDSDIPLAKKSAPLLIRKRKISEESSSNIGEVKAKIQNVELPIKIASVSNSLPVKQYQNATTTLATGLGGSATLIQPPKPNQQFLINNNITVQLNNRNLTAIGHPIRPSTSFRSQNFGSIPGSQSAVKIVQLPPQNGQNQQRIQMQLPGQQGTPPPLFIRNRGVQIRPHVNILNASPNNNQNRTTTTTVQLGVRQVSEHAPVYHNIGGFCIDLNSAAQHDSIRLPNGKLIQVKKSTTNNPNNISSMRQQIPSGVLSPIQNQPQHQFTITQSAGPISNVPITNSTQVAFQTSTPIQQHPQTQNIQTVPQTHTHPTIMPNISGQIQILSGDLMHNTNNANSGKPQLVRNTYGNSPIGKGRCQLQNQIYNAMDIFQHLSTKLQTLTNSNPYKNANSLGDVKELYIHLLYLFTYGIGRMKTMQDKVIEDMTNMGFKTDVSNLNKGQTKEKYSSDGDEDEIEIVEPKTTLINLDSDNEDSDESNSKIMITDTKSQTTTQIDKIPATKKINAQKQVARKQIESLQRKIIPTSGYRIILPKTWQINQQNMQSKIKQQTQILQPTQQSQPIQNQQVKLQNISNNLINSKTDIQLNQEIEEDFSPLSLLAGMLEVELTEGNDAIKTSLEPKKRKKITNKPRPKLLKQNLADNDAVKMEKIKNNDSKLKQNCIVNIKRLDKESNNFKEALKRFVLRGQNKEKNILIQENINESFEMIEKIRDSDESSQSKENVYENNNSDVSKTKTNTDKIEKNISTKFSNQFEEIKDISKTTVNENPNQVKDNKNELKDDAVHIQPTVHTSDTKSTILIENKNCTEQSQISINGSTAESISSSAKKESGDIQKSSTGSNILENESNSKLKSLINPSLVENKGDNLRKSSYDKVRMALIGDDSSIVEYESDHLRKFSIVENEEDKIRIASIGDDSSVDENQSDNIKKISIVENDLQSPIGDDSSVDENKSNNIQKFSIVGNEDNKVRLSPIGSDLTIVEYDSENDKVERSPIGDVSSVVENKSDHIQKITIVENEIDKVRISPIRDYSSGVENKSNRITKSSIVESGDDKVQRSSIGDDSPVVGNKNDNMQKSSIDENEDDKVQKSSNEDDFVVENIKKISIVENEIDKVRISPIRDYSSGVENKSNRIKKSSIVESGDDKVQRSSIGDDSSVVGNKNDNMQKSSIVENEDDKILKSSNEGHSVVENIKTNSIVENEIDKVQKSSIGDYSSGVENKSDRITKSSIVQSGDDNVQRSSIGDDSSVVGNENDNMQKSSIVENKDDKIQKSSNEDYFVVENIEESSIVENEEDKKRKSAIGVNSLIVENKSDKIRKFSIDLQSIKNKADDSEKSLNHSQVVENEIEQKSPIVEYESNNLHKFLVIENEDDKVRKSLIGDASSLLENKADDIKKNSIHSPVVEDENEGEGINIKSKYQDIENEIEKEIDVLLKDVQENIEPENQNDSALETSNQRQSENNNLELFESTNYNLENKLSKMETKINETNCVDNMMELDHIIEENKLNDSEINDGNNKVIIPGEIAAENISIHTKRDDIFTEVS